MKKVLWFAFVLAWTGCALPSARPTEPPTPAKYLQAREQKKAPRAIVAAPPPPRRPEASQPPSPGGSAIWRAGYWEFEGGQYRWISGAWVVPPRAGLTWVPGFFRRTTEGGLFINGHWRPN